MSFDIPDTGEPPRRPAPPGRRSRGALVPTLVILLVLGFGFTLFANFWTDLLWFRSVGYVGVFSQQLLIKGGLFLALGLVMAGLVALNLLVAYRLRPGFRGMTLEQQSLDRYRMALEPYRRLAVIAVSAGIGLLAGVSASGQWRTWMAWRNSVPFGVKDKQFDLDVSFFSFGLPWWRFLLSFAFAAVILSLILSIATHYLYGGLRLQSPGTKASPGAQAHLSVLLGVAVLFKAVGYWLDRYALAVESSDFVVQGWTGLRYKDVHAVLPSKTILASIAVICALLFFLNVVRRTWMLPGVGFGLLVLSALLIGGVYPTLVQQFQVKPSEGDKEAPYIQRNIEATKKAYGLDKVKVTPYDAKTQVAAGQLRNDADTTASIRLLDPSVITPTIQQLQQIKSFYGFSGALDVDRYEVDGKLQDMVVAVRELDLAGIPPEQRTWVNQHIQYTHGFGFVGALGTRADSNGNPVFVESNLPPTGKIGSTAKYEPRIYFGEKSPEYSIVGGPPGGPKSELDYPDDKSPSGQASYTYQGKGGVAMSSLFERILYATKFREGNILLSGSVNDQSRVMYVRDPRQRVEQVAPWLSLDSDPYPAVVNGRIQWIIDGYTTTNGFPYASKTTLNQATTDSLTNSQRTVVGTRDQVNYIRNSVKATVDAYDGSVNLYAWQEDDPVLRTWMKAFPGTVKPFKAINTQLLSHLRYPQDLFKVQREIYRQYHVGDGDPKAFYGGQDFWKVPADPNHSDTPGAGADALQPPYYLTLQMPGQAAPTFSLTSTFVPNARPNLAAFMSVDAQPGPGYGTIRVLQLSRNTTIPGPGQAQNNFEAQPAISEQLSLLRRGGSEIKFGNLLTLPVGGGLLYIEPVYVQASSGTRYPLLKKVLVGFGDQIQMRDTLQEALDAVFQGDAGSRTGEDGDPPTTTPPSGGTTPPTGGGNPNLQAAIRDAAQAFQEGEQALRDNDFAKYGEAQRRLKEALSRAAAASGKG